MLQPTSDVAVFGGTGFIGRNVVRLLADKGHRVRVVSRQTHSPTQGVRYLRADFSDPFSLRAAVDGASVVYHIAAGGGERWSDFEREVVQGACQIATLAQSCGVGRFIYTSSIAALDLGRKRKIDEQTGPDLSPKRRSLYSRAKIAAEAALNRMYVETGLPLVIFRPGLVLGTGGILTHGGLGYWPSDTCCVGWGCGKYLLPLVLVQDVAAAMVAAMDAPRIEGLRFNLVGDVRMSAAEFVKVLAERSYRRFRFYPQSLVKLQALEIVKWIAKTAARKAENPFPSYHDLKSRSLQSDFDCSAAKRLLGWRPVAQREEFLRNAMDVNLPVMHPSDLRLASAIASL